MDVQYQFCKYLVVFCILCVNLVSGQLLGVAIDKQTFSNVTFGNGIDGLAQQNLVIQNVYGSPTLLDVSLSILFEDVRYFDGLTIEVQLHCLERSQTSRHRWFPLASQSDAEQVTSSQILSVTIQNRQIAHTKDDKYLYVFAVRDNNLIIKPGVAQFNTFFRLKKMPDTYNPFYVVIKVGDGFQQASITSNAFQLLYKKDVIQRKPYGLFTLQSLPSQNALAYYMTPQRERVRDSFAHVSRYPLFRKEDAQYNDHMTQSMLPPMLHHVQPSMQPQVKETKLKRSKGVRTIVSSTSFKGFSSLYFNQFHHRDEQHLLPWGVVIGLQYHDCKNGFRQALTLPIEDKKVSYYPHLDRQLERRLNAFLYTDRLDEQMLNKLQHQGLREYVSWNIVSTGEFRYKVTVVKYKRLVSQEDEEWPDYTSVTGHMYTYRLFYKCISMKCPTGWMVYRLTYKPLVKTFILNWYAQARQIQSYTNMFLSEEASSRLFTKQCTPIIVGLTRLKPVVDMEPFNRFMDHIRQVEQVSSSLGLEAGSNGQDDDISDMSPGVLRN
ncbi:hypothetical protein MP228_001739 [Amoeboaphelidium protococcarum]|nr:hypothetical protein MP228_001739 [Amoeboaphelidium protococcarum]